MNSMAAFFLGLTIGVAFGWLTLGLCVAAKRAFDEEDEVEEDEQR